MEEFFAERCGIPYHRVMAEDRIGFPTVNIQTEFFVPLVYGDEAEVEIAISTIGRSSATFVYSIRRANDGILCARSTNVHVSMNLDTLRAVPLPPRYRGCLTENGS